MKIIVALVVLTLISCSKSIQLEFRSSASPPHRAEYPLVDKYLEESLWQSSSGAKCNLIRFPDRTTVAVNCYFNGVKSQTFLDCSINNNSSFLFGFVKNNIYISMKCNSSFL